MTKLLKGYQLDTTTSVNKTVNDIRELKSIGVNIVRIPLYLSYYQDINHWISFLKTVLPVCHELNIRPVVALHHPNRGNPSTQEILDVPQFYKDWADLSRALQTYRFVAIPINEPHRINSGVRLRKIYGEVAKIIKGRVICFAIPSVVTTDLRKWKPIPNVPRQWTEVHCYDYNFGSVATGTKQYPVGRKNREDLKKRIEAVANWSKANNSIVFIGETAIPYNADSAEEYLTDFMQLCRKIKVPYALHAYKEADVWNYMQIHSLWCAILKEFKK